MHTYFEQHDITYRVQRLARGGRDDDDAEKIDKDITTAMLSAELACKSQSRSPWSTDLHEAMTTLHILQRHLTQLKTHIDMSVSIANKHDSLPNPVPLPSDIPTTNSAIRIARKATRLIVKDAKNIAETYKREKITAHQLARPKIDPNVIENQIRQNHAMKEMYRKVPSSKPRISGGISMIKIPTDPTADPKNPTTKFSSVVDPVQIENLIIAHNKKHFRQAEVTPLAAPNVTASLGFSGTLPTAQTLLDGTATLPTLTENRFGQAILKQCQRQLPEIKSDIHFDTFKSAYKNWKVSTSTSPSNRHLSHQHALFQPHGIPLDKPEKIDQAETSRDAIWAALYGIVKYATTHGYFFTRW